MRRGTEPVASRYGVFDFRYGLPWPGPSPYLESKRRRAGAPYLDANRLPGQKLFGCVDAIIIMMRTTLNLPDDIEEVIRSFAEVKGISLGEAVAELVRKGLQPRPRTSAQGVFPQFDVPEGAPPITLEQTLAAEDEL